MTQFPLNTIDSAPERSKAGLTALRGAFGFVPNIAAAMSNSPVLINSLVGLFGNVHGGSFNEAEIQTLLLTNAVANRAAWPVAFHSFLALKEGVEPDDVQAVRAGRVPTDPKLGSLSALAKALIESRGNLKADEQERFIAAGYGPDHLLEVIAVISASTITNYTANVTQPPLEPQFMPHEWTPESLA